MRTELVLKGLAIGSAMITLATLRKALRMCGIAGYWDRGSNPLQAVDLETTPLRRAGRALAHRGPDAEGIWRSEDGALGLLHRRLAIIDLNERSSQPMISHSRRSVLTYNGEIYNFQILQNGLNQVPWRTLSDTEVVLEALEQRGAAALNQFDGMFALAQFDQRKKELILAVDPLGKKPLYTYWDGKVFAFASEIKAFRAMGLRLDVCQEGLSEYFLFGASLDTGTVFKNIRRLPGGHFQTVIDGRPTRARPYWDLPLGQIDMKMSYQDAVHAVQDLVSRAVKKRLVADVPIGCFLSGGLDSSAVAFEAQHALGQERLKTFSVGFPDQGEFDETRYARLVSDKISSEHSILNGMPPSIDQISEILKHFDEPFPDSSLLPTFALCREVGAKVKVALSGDGGDEIFGGYRRMQAGVLTERWGGLLRLMLQPLVWGGIQSRSPRSRLGFLLRLQSALRMPLSRRLLHWNSYFTEESLARHLSTRWDLIQNKLDHWEEILEGQEIGQKILYLNAKTYLFSDLLPKVDRMSMYHSLEVRSPLLDKELVEFSFRLPSQFKFSALHTKRILKSAYRQQLGTEIVDRKKQGFATPLHSWVTAWKASTESGLDRFGSDGIGDLKGLLESQVSTSRFDSCAFSMWSASVNLPKATLEGVGS